MSLVPSLEQINTVFDVLNQTVRVAQSVCTSGLRGWRIWQTWNDPNLNRFLRMFYIAADGAGIATDATLLTNTYHPILDNKDIENISKVSNAAILGADIIRVMHNENRSATDVVVLGTQALLSANQAVGGGQDLQQAINLGGTIALCYTQKEWIQKQLKTLRQRTRQKYAQAGNTPTSANIRKNAQEEYQDRVLLIRESSGEQENSELVLRVVEKQIEDDLLFVRACMQENKLIIRKDSIVKFEKIPNFLRNKEEFAKRKCRVSHYPVRRAVVVQEFGSSIRIYYDLKTLKDFYEKKKGQPPSGWPQSLPFSYQSIQEDREETEKITQALRQALAVPEVHKRVKSQQLEYKNIEKHLKEMLDLCERDIEALTPQI